MISRPTARLMLATLILLVFSVSAPDLPDRWSAALVQAFPASLRFARYELVVGLSVWATVACASLVPGALVELGLTVRGASDRLDELLGLPFLRGTAPLWAAAGLSVPLRALYLDIPGGGPRAGQGLAIFPVLTAAAVTALLLYLAVRAISAEWAEATYAGTDDDETLDG